jgi:hypothetical protein
MTTAEVLHTLQDRYGEDVAQEALCQTLEATGAPVMGYAMRVGYLLQKAHFSDTKIRWTHTATRTREHVTQLDLQRHGESDGMWMQHHARNPVYIVIALEALGRLPLWVILRHLSDGLRILRPCQHDRLRWYFRPTTDGPSVRCHVCDTEANHRQRARRLAAGV